MKMKKKNYFIGSSLLFLLVVGTLYFIMREQAFSDMYRVITKANPLYLGLGIISMLVFIFFEGCCIKVVMDSLGRRITLTDSYKYALIGFFFSAITPGASGGQPAQVYFMRKDGHEITLSTLMLLIVLAIFQIVMLLLGSILILSRYSLVVGQVEGYMIFFVYGVIFNITMVIFLLYMIFSKNVASSMIKNFIRFLGKVRIIKNVEKLIDKIERLMEQYKQGAAHIRRNPIVLLKLFVLTIFQFVASWSVPYFVYRSLGLNGIKYFDIVSMQAVLDISVASLPLPGGTGAAENGFIQLFSDLFGSHMVIPGMMLSRGISFYSLLIISGVIIVFSFKRKNLNKRDLIS